MNYNSCRLNTDTSLECCANLCCNRLVILGNVCCLLDLNSVLACEVLLEDTDKVLTCQVALLTDNSLDIAWEYFNS